MEFYVHVDKEDIPDDGYIYVDIDDYEVQDACADLGGCCDGYHEDETWVALQRFLEDLDHYYFQQNLPKDNLYNEVVRMATRA